MIRSTSSPHKSVLTPSRARLLAAVLMALTGALAGGAQYLHNQAEQRLHGALTARSQNMARLEHAPAEEKEQNERVLLFDELSRRGMIDGESRGASEFLDTLFSGATVLDAQYELLPPNAISPVEATMTREKVPGYTENRSRLKFKLHLLHDGEIPHLLAAIRQQAPALARARSCSLRRSAVSPLVEKTAGEETGGNREDNENATSSVTLSAANPVAECVFDWTVFVPEP